uniref:EF-hand domain-containing protein n=1 Tax=Macrostomum lignano TaxID=282301 RepID=A0A1I8FJE3_9PLAT
MARSCHSWDEQNSPLARSLPNSTAISELQQNAAARKLIACSALYDGLYVGDYDDQDMQFFKRVILDQWDVNHDGKISKDELKMILMQQSRRIASQMTGMFPETTVLAPQQAEGVVCNWLQTTAARMKLLDDESRLYGKVIFDPLVGEVPAGHCELASSTTGLPAAVWRNEAGNIFEIITAEPLKKVRLLDVAPNQLAACMFLGNHNRLIDDFLDPLLASVRDIGLPPPGEKPGTAGTSGRPCTSFAPPLTAEQEHLFSCLTGEFDVSQLVVPELQLALSAIQQAAKGITVAEQPSVAGAAVGAA